MKSLYRHAPLCLVSTLACALAIPAQAGLINNGGFESGFTGWTRADQLGSNGTFALQTGTASPVNGFPVPPPPGPIRAAMSDAPGPGSHVLYQDFVVPTSVVGPYFATFSLYINNGHGSPTFFLPSTLNWSTPTLNQQARVDIMKTSADPFSVLSADILQNLYQTATLDPLVSGYNTILRDVTAVLQANQGQTLRLRFAEVDNVAPFNLGVDNVDINAVPEPASWMLVFGALIGTGFIRSRRV